MYHTIGGKWLKLTLFAYFILAIIGSSAISAGEAFWIEYSQNDSLNSGTYSLTDHTIDWLAGVTLRKPNGNSNSPLRNGSLRVFMFAGTIAMAVYLAGANIKNKNYSILTIKNSVLLKLRI